MSKYKTPEQYPAKETKRAVSSRIKITTWEYLKKQAEKRGGQSLSELLEYVIEDYTEWLRRQD